MQTSFVPKKPITESRASGSGVGLFLLLSIILFIVAAALAGGVWFWQKSLLSKIENSKLALVADRDSYQEDTINGLVRLNDRIEESKKLLSKHLAVSPVFTLLEQNILRNIRLKTMKFSSDTNNKINLSLSGTAVSYDVLSKQSDAFGTSTLRKFISDPAVSDFSPMEDGSISFDFTATLNPVLVSYESVISSAQ